MKQKTISIINGQLLNYHNQLVDMENSIHGLLFMSRIQDFKQNNGALVKTLTERIKALEKKYFLLDAKKQVVYENEYREQEKHIVTVKFFGLYKKDRVEKEKVPTGRKLPVLITGMQMSGYEKEFNALMNEPVTILLN